MTGGPKAPGGAAPGGPPVWTPKAQAYSVGPIPAPGTDSGTNTWMLAETFTPLNSDRYVSVGFTNSTGATSKAGPATMAFPILDLTTGKVTEPVLASNGALPMSTSLQHYDPAKGDAGLFTGFGDGATQYTYAHWDLASGKVDWTTSLGELNDHTSMQPIGVDPKGQYFYFLKETAKDHALGSYSHGDQATVGRVDLKTHAVDWTHDVPLPGRTGTHDGGLSVQPSADFSKFAITEYSNAVDPANPAQGIVVDVATQSHTSFPIPATPYGVTFDRQNRYLAIAGNSEAKIHRYDLATNKEDLVVGSVGHVQALALSSDNAHLYVFTQGRTMEVRDWPSLKLVKNMAAGSVLPGQAHLGGDGMAVMPDGKHAVLSKTEEPYGFRDATGFFSVGL